VRARALVAAAAVVAFAVAAGASLAGGAGPWRPRSETVSRGNVRAQLHYQLRRNPGLPQVRALRLRIYVASQLRRDDRLTFGCPYCFEPLSALGGGAKSLTVRDLDGDGRLDVVADFYTGGAHCCSVSAIYGYRAGTNSFGRLIHTWGDPGYRFADLDHDGVPELRSADDRFAYAFTCYACSPLPIEIWHYRAGALVDVTRRYRAAIRADASSIWRLYLSERRRADGDVRGILAAYLADKYLLGTQADGWRRLRQANARHELHPPGGCFSSTPCDATYLRKLSRFLARIGYRR
jgi:hypothetical protein